MIGSDPEPDDRRHAVRWNERATWEVAAVLIVLAAIIVLAADGAGLIPR
ncbi:MAG TPA: hypothetical protein VHS36_00240 [Candidatus Limnocylindrales bacterium]|jgi:hypothetical protein|nr:hypothetical protein [Candidatus Limnocylindrales bacterium]